MQLVWVKVVCTVKGTSAGETAIVQAVYHTQSNKGPFCFQKEPL